MSAERTWHSNLQYRRRPRWLILWAFLCTLALAFGAAPARAQPEYLLAPGDILKISVFKNPDLSLDVRVSESGAIGYPLIGSVPVKGLTLPAAESKIAQMLRDGGFVVNPQVNILLTEGFGNLVSVIGEVNKSGRYSVDVAAAMFPACWRRPAESHPTAARWSRYPECGPGNPFDATSTS